MKSKTSEEAPALIPLSSLRLKTQDDNPFELIFDRGDETEVYSAPFLMGLVLKTSPHHSGVARYSSPDNYNLFYRRWNNLAESSRDCRVVIVNNKKQERAEVYAEIKGVIGEVAGDLQRFREDLKNLA